MNRGITFCSVGRPGLDPGTLGLKEGCIWSDWSGGVAIIRESKKICPVVSDSSGGVGLVCGMKCGISERVTRLRKALIHQRCSTLTLSERQPPRVSQSGTDVILREFGLQLFRRDSDAPAMCFRRYRSGAFEPSQGPSTGLVD